MSLSGSNLKLDNETVDEFFDGRLRVLQKEKGYRFSLDSILLANFVILRGGEQIVDLGTGSGIVAMILSLRSADVNIAEVEIQKDMADMATRSVALNGLEGRIRVYQADVRNISRVFDAQSFDIAVFNPPYRRLNSGKINPDSEKAVARHEVKGTIDDFLAGSRYLLKDSGRVYIIYPAARMVQLIARMRHYDLEPKRLRIVHSNGASGGVFVLAEGLRGGGEEAKILPPLFIYNDDGIYTKEVKDILRG